MRTTLLVACLAGMITAYAQTASLDWAAKMGGSLKDDPYAILVDAAGNVYTAGNYKAVADFDPGAGTYTLQISGGSDAFISKLDASGNFLWAKRIGGPSFDYIFGCAIDAAGNVYSTGEFSGTVDFDPGAATYTMSAQGVKNIFISKLDAAGNFVWAKKLGNTGASIFGGAITLDPSGNIYVGANITGTVDLDPGVGTYTLPSGSNASAHIVTLDAAGSFVRAKQYSGSSSVHILKIISDATGNIYASGTFRGTADFDPGAGTYTLTQTVNTNTQVATTNDLFVLKTDPAGDFVWAKHIGGATYYYANSIAVDLQQNVYTVGVFAGGMDFDPGPGTYSVSSAAPSSIDTYILKLDASGNFSRVQTIGKFQSQCISQHVTTDASDHVYVTGNYYGPINFDPGVSNITLTPNGLYDAFILELDPLGGFVQVYSMGGSGEDFGLRIAIDAAGYIYTTGTFEDTVNFDPGTGVTNLSSSGQTDVFIQKLNKGITGLKKTEGLSGLRLYPNPANHFLKLDITNPELASGLNNGAFAELVNPLGQVVLREQISGKDLTINISTLSPGLYVVRIRHDNGILLNQKIVKE